jgi:hypothetical protein
LRIRSLAGYVIGTLESRFRKRQGVGSAGEILSSMANQTRREHVGASMSSVTIPVAPGGSHVRPRLIRRSSSVLPMETSYDPQGEGGLARYGPRWQWQSFHRFRRARAKCGLKASSIPMSRRSRRSSCRDSYRDHRNHRARPALAVVRCSRGWCDRLNRRGSTRGSCCRKT